MVLLLCTLCGCASVADVAGAVAGLASGAATGNPAVGIGVGVSVRAAANEGVRYVARRRQQNEQDAVASVVAEMKVGETRPWAVDQRVAGDAHGEVRVVRLIKTPLTVCKEILFSVVGDEAPTVWFSTTACDEGGQWRWAAAEPAVDRWVNLQ